MQEVSLTTNLLEFFDRIYVLNLPQRVDRRREMEAELARIGIPFESPKVEVFPAIRPDRADEFESIGAKGAFFSHLAMLKQAHQQELKNVLILEDDLEIVSVFQQFERSLLQELQESDWDLAHFGYCSKQIATAENVSSPIFQSFSGEITGAHFYAVNGKTFDRLIFFLESLLQRPVGHPDGGPMPIDGGFNVFRWKNPDILRLIAVPNFGYQRSSRSDITPSWFDRIPVISSLVTVARWTKFNKKLKKLF